MTYKNLILIKLNQIGSVSETLEAIKMAHNTGYTAISSHRSGGERQRISIARALLKKENGIFRRMAKLQSDSAGWSIA